MNKDLYIRKALITENFSYLDSVSSYHLFYATSAHGSTFSTSGNLKLEGTNPTTAKADSDQGDNSSIPSIVSVLL